MEFPLLGQYCSVRTCNRLDILPMKCNSCSAVLCKDHIKYDEHQCPSSYRKNVRISLCSLCNKVVRLQNRDQSLDVAAFNHFDDECKCDPLLKKREKVYSYKCSVVSCKQREAIEVTCYKCLKTFCLKHRFPDDHKCQQYENTDRAINLPGETVIESINKTESNNITASDDELLAQTIKLSLNQMIQVENDFLLAKSLQESEQEEIRRNHVTPMVTTSSNDHQSNRKKTCCCCCFLQ